MADDPRLRIRSYLDGRLKEKDDIRPFTDGESLFVSGRLDSLDAMETVVFLEENFSVDFAESGFDQSLIDSVDAIVQLIGSSEVR